MRRRLATLTGAILIGLVALAFARLADVAQGGFSLFYARWPLAATAATPLLFGLLSWLTIRYAPLARGSGIPQVIAVSSQPHPEHSALISPVTALWKAVLTLAALAGGASVGREGPTVQLSAAIMVGMHRLFRVPLSAAVVIAGGAAGVSAAFNTPLAGIVFAVEELAAAYEQRLALLSMAAVVIAGMVSLGLAGDYLYFGALHDTLSLSQAFYVVPVVAVLGGIAGGVFSRLLLMASSGSVALVRSARQRPVLVASGCGVLVALIGAATGGLTWGTGYAPAKALVEGLAEPGWLAPAKFVASLATAASGIPGGIFAPALSTGAALGGLLTGLFPGVPLGSVVLLGMTAYFVGVVRAPLTSVVIVMEMTDSRSMLVMLLAAALIADAAASLICRERLYAGLARSFRPGPPTSAPASSQPPET